MTFGLDTSVVIRLLTGEPRPLALQVMGRVTEILRSGGQCEVCDRVVTETYFALQYHYKMPKDAALAALAAFSDGERIRFSAPATALLKTTGLSRANPGFADRLIHAGYLQSGFRMLTCELSATALEGAEVIKNIPK
jgi:predicted nucleic acid-binding protein